MKPFSSLSAMGPDVGRAIGMHWDRVFRSLEPFEYSHAEQGYFRVMTGEAHPFANLAFLAPSADLAAAHKGVDPLIACRMPSAVAFPGMEVPPDIGAYLVAQGFTPGGVPAMGVDIANLQPTTLPPGYEFTRITAGPDGDDWVRQMAIGFELPPVIASLFAPESLGAGTSPDSPWGIYAVRRGGKTVATSLCGLIDGLAGIYCVSTIPEERGKGLGAHATAEPLRLAARAGYGVGILQSSEAGYPVYKRLGFADFGQVPFYVRMTG